jgi:hypothetical protein
MVEQTTTKIKKKKNNTIDLMHTKVISVTLLQYGQRITVANAI